MLTMKQVYRIKHLKKFEGNKQSDGIIIPTLSQYKSVL